MKKGHEIGYLILNRVAALNQALKVSGGGGGGGGGGTPLTKLPLSTRLPRMSTKHWLRADTRIFNLPSLKKR